VRSAANGHVFSSSTEEIHGDGFQSGRPMAEGFLSPWPVQVKEIEGVLD